MGSADEEEESLSRGQLAKHRGRGRTGRGIMGHLKTMGQEGERRLRTGRLKKKEGFAKLEGKCQLFCPSFS